MLHAPYTMQAKFRRKWAFYALQCSTFGKSRALKQEAFGFRQQPALQQVV
jgi:hypothetical protein